MIIRESPNKSRDGLKGMLLVEMLNEMEKFEKVMTRKSITSAQIEKATSTIRELRLSLEKQTESVSPSVTDRKTKPKEDYYQSEEFWLGWTP